MIDDRQQDPLQAQPAQESPRPQEISDEDMAYFGVEEYKPTREQRQRDKIRENVQSYLKSRPDRKELEELAEFGAEPAPPPEDEYFGVKAGKKAFRIVASRAIGSAGDVIQLADSAYQRMQGGEKGLFGKGLAWLAEFVHPATTEGIRQAIDEATGGRYAPESTTEVIANNFLDFASMGGMLGALKKGRIVRELGGAAGAAALPEVSDDPTTKAYLTFAGDVLGRGAISPTARKEMFAGIASIPQKLKNLSPSAVKSAENLGIIPSVGESIDSAFIRKLEGSGSEAALAEASGKIIGKLEGTVAEGLGKDTAERAAVLGEKVAEESAAQLGRQLSERESAFEAIGEKFGDAPIETPTSSRVYESYQKGASFTPETKKAIEEATGKIFEETGQVPKVAEDLSKKSMTNLELGKEVQQDITFKAKEAHKAARDKYTRLERIGDRIPVAEDAMTPVMKQLAEIGESGAPDYLKTRFNLISTRAGKIAEAVEAGARVPTNQLIKLEQLINDAIKWDAMHDHTRMLVPLKNSISNMIEETLPQASQAIYRDAKNSWAKYYETYLDPDAVRKMRFTQKPEELETLIKTPSYLEQVTKTVDEKTANAVRRKVVEQVGTGQDATQKFTEYRGVFGDKYDEVLDAIKKSEGKEAASIGNLASAVEKIDERLAKTIGDQERNALTKMRQSIVQDMKKAHPDSAGFIREHFGKLGPEATMRRDLARAYASGDPEKFLGSLRTKKDLGNLKKSLSSTPKGQELYDSVRRMKLTDMLNKTIMEGGELQFSKLGNVFEELLGTEMGRELIGKENISLFKDIGEYSELLDRSAQEFLEAGKKYTGPYSHMATLFGGSVAVMNGHFFLPMMFFGAKTSKRLLVKYLTDPKVKELVYKNLQRTAPEMAKGAMTLDRAYKLTRPMLDWTLPEVEKYKEEG